MTSIRKLGNQWKVLWHFNFHSCILLKNSVLPYWSTENTKIHIWKFEKHSNTRCYIRNFTAAFPERRGGGKRNCWRAEHETKTEITLHYCWWLKMTSTLIYSFVKNTGDSKTFKSCLYTVDMCTSTPTSWPAGVAAIKCLWPFENSSF